MKRAKLFFMFLFLLHLVATQAQSPSYVLHKEIDRTALFVKADILGNIYLSDGSVLYKYDNQFNLQHSYSDFSMGKIQAIDVSNPMKILVFSKDFMRLTFLNNTLAKQNSPYLLSELNIIQPACVCVSYDNGFWIYDEMKDALIRFDANAQRVSESKTINSLVGQKVNPLQMQEVGGKYLMLSDPKIGFLVFDIYGTYLKTIPVAGIQAFSVWTEKIVYVKDTILNVLNPETLDTLYYTLPQSDVKEAVISGKYLILMDSEGRISVYTR